MMAQAIAKRPPKTRSNLRSIYLKHGFKAAEEAAEKMPNRTAKKLWFKYWRTTIIIIGHTTMRAYGCGRCGCR